MRPFRFPAVIFAASVFAGFALFSSCVSTPSAATALAVPRFIELQDEPAISTFHFPRGFYSLDSEDRAGYYYRAPRSLIKHSFAGFAKYDGGIFVPKRQRTRIRGYLIWAGGRTKIGDLANARYVFRD